MISTGELRPIVILRFLQMVHLHVPRELLGDLQLKMGAYLQKGLSCLQSEMVLKSMAALRSTAAQILFRIRQIHFRFLIFRMSRLEDM